MNALTREFEVSSPTVDASPDYSSYQQFRLEVISGPDAGRVYVSTKLRVSIGTDPACDLRLEDPSVAPFQCEIVAQADRIDIIDLRHANTTRVNELEVAKAHLSRTLTIGVGNSKIRFERMSSSLHVRRSRETSFGELVGNSAAMRDLFVILEEAAANEAPILLKGEAGSGKEAVARAIHRHSRRRGGPFHLVNCAASHAEVERGLIAAFEKSAGGTLFLSEVGEMSPDLQARLLRVFRNGGPGAIADLRILSSSTADLREAVNEGRLESELYSFLVRGEATVPSLRQRMADLPRLVGHLLTQLGANNEPVAEDLRDGAFLALLQRYGWPGNVRELRNHLMRCVQQGRALPVGQAAANVNDGTAAVATPSPPVDISRPIKAGREEWIKYFERLYLADILEAQGGNVTRAAKAAGVDRGHFYRLMMRCGLRN